MVRASTRPNLTTLLSRFPRGGEAACGHRSARGRWIRVTPTCCCNDTSMVPYWCHGLVTVRRGHTARAGGRRRGRRRRCPGARRATHRAAGVGGAAHAPRSALGRRRRGHARARARLGRAAPALGRARFAVTAPPGEPIDDPEPATEAAAPPPDADEGATARINLRLPEH